MLTKETVQHVAKLARLKLTEAEIADCAKVLSAVLENFEQIAGVDTQDIHPLVSPTEISPSFREDLAERTIDSDDLLDNAPEKSGRLFKVPPVV